MSTDIKPLSRQDEVGEEAEAIADRIVSRVLPPVPDRLTFHVWHDGDSSVGLPGDRCTVEIDLRSYEQADRRDYIERVRESLKASFGAIWDTRPKVMTADEIRAEEAWLDEGGKVWKQGDTAKFGKNNERDAPAPMPQPVSGFVLAFPGASEAEGDELIETLRMGGNTVYRVDSEAAGRVLREVAAWAGLEADDFQP